MSQHLNFFEVLSIEISEPVSFPADGSHPSFTSRHMLITHKVVGEEKPQVTRIDFFTNKDGGIEIRNIPSEVASEDS